MDLHALSHTPSSSAPLAPWRRHLEGWPFLAVSLGIAWLGTLLMLPRPVMPRVLPLPVPEAARLRALEQEQHTRAEALAHAPAQERSLPPGFDLRALGDAFRAYGRVDASVERAIAQLMQAHQRVLGAVQQVLSTQGVAPIVELRDYETDLFVAAAERWQPGEPPAADLVELGGDFTGLLTRSDWISSHGGLRVPHAVLRALFQRRFREITSLQDPSLQLDREQLRALYAFLLSHPPPFSGEVPLAGERQRWQWLQRRVDELSGLDPTYPVNEARGVIFANLGDPTAARLFFARHLSEHPEGPDALRVQDFAVASR